ncbi:Hypothetical predicted protein [Cloeon dipterum]|uniref:C2H2-type domain-containing protein n=1 Tax=Cloeon dipterum TaxID=197152 RepID=A0A8S1E2J5_9INSE|nr:Hypothetical predicted protein [Cloeon dipterum]
MSLQKVLCLICELPTADGAISAVQVDKDKLQEWFLNVCGHEMAEEVDDDDLICYFCLWHAEFQLKFDELADEALVWWNLGLELDDAARELRRNYFEGKLEQCWVQLEKIEIPQSADGEEGQIVEAKIRLRRWNCIYCGKRYKDSSNMYKHVKKMHKQALRCAAGNGRDVKAVDPELLKAHVWPQLSHQNENRHTFILYPRISVTKTDDNLIYLLQEPGGQRAKSVAISCWSQQDAV